MKASVDPDALLCALILAPRMFPRNRYFSLYESSPMKKVRRRAGRVRGIIRQLVATGMARAEITGEQILEDGRLLMRYRIGHVALNRTTALTALEAATLHYALHRAGVGSLDPLERQLVETTLERLGDDLDLDAADSRRGRR